MWLEIDSYQPEITWVNAELDENSIAKGNQCLLIKNSQYQVNYILDSSINCKSLSSSNLWMQGSSWMLELKYPSLNQNFARWMDWIDSEIQTSFIYLLPLTPTQAIIELVLIDHNSVNTDTIDKLYSDYLTRNFSDIKSSSRIHSRYQPISLCHKKFNSNSNTYFKLGTPAGQIKSLTGFGLTRILNHSQTVINSISSKQRIPQFQSPWYYKWVDKYGLWKFTQSPESNKAFFKKIYSQIPGDTLLAFLDESLPWQKFSMFGNLILGK